MGGDCLNYGCVPSKAVIRSSRIAADIRAADRFGVKVPAGSEVDFPAVMERMRRLRAQISQHDSAQRFRALGVDVFLGEARFTGARTVEVAGTDPELHKSRDCHRRPAGAAIRTGNRSSGFSHQRDGLFADRTSAPPFGHRRRTHRLRVCPGLAASGLPGQLAAQALPDHESGGWRRRGTHPKYFLKGRD